MPECALCGDAVARGGSLLPFRSPDRSVALAHSGCEAGERLPFLLREPGAKRATHVCEHCADDVAVRRVQVTGADRETEFRRQFRCPGCGAWVGPLAVAAVAVGLWALPGLVALGGALVAGGA